MNEKHKKQLDVITDKLNEAIDALLDLSVETEDEDKEISDQLYEVHNEFNDSYVKLFDILESTKNR